MHILTGCGGLCQANPREAASQGDLEREEPGVPGSVSGFSDSRTTNTVTGRGVARKFRGEHQGPRGAQQVKGLKGGQYGRHLRL